MAKPNGNRRKFYDAYKNQGRREKNKERKAAKAEKRAEYFRKRKEAGTAARLREEHKADKNYRPAEKEPICKSYARTKAFMDRLDHQLEEAAKAAKLEKEKKHKKGWKE